MKERRRKEMLERMKKQMKERRKQEAEKAMRKQGVKKMEKVSTGMERASKAVKQAMTNRFAVEGARQLLKLQNKLQNK